MDQNRPHRPLSKMQHLAVFAIYFILACLLTYPLVFSLQGHTFGMDDHPGLHGDFFHHWNILQAYQDGRVFRYFMTDAVNYPFGQDIGNFVGISLHLFFYLPFAKMLDIFGQTNIVMILILALNGYCMFVFCRRLFNDTWVAMACGFFLLMNPLVFLKVNQGFVQKSILFWIPLFWGAVLHVKRLGRLRDSLAAGLWLSLISATYPQFAYYSLMLLALLIVYFLLTRDRFFSFLFKMIPAAIVFACFTALMFVIVREPVSTNSHGPIDWFNHVSILLSSPFRSFPYTGFHLNIPFPVGISPLLFVGGLAGGILLHDKYARFYLAGMLFFLLMAAGKFFPYGLVVQHLPFAHRLGFPIRVLPFYFFCAIVLTGLLMVWLSQRFSIRTIGLALFLICLYAAENMILLSELYPPTVQEAGIPSYCRQINKENGAAILHLPKTSTNHYFYACAMSGKKCVNPYFVQQVPGRGFVQEFPEPEASPRQKRRYLCELAGYDIRHLIVHTDQKTTTGQQEGDLRWLEQFLGQPRHFDSDRVKVFQINQTSLCYP